MDASFGNDPKRLCELLLGEHAALRPHLAAAHQFEVGLSLPREVARLEGKNKTQSSTQMAEEASAEAGTDARWCVCVPAQCAKAVKDSLR